MNAPAARAGGGGHVGLGRVAGAFGVRGWIKVAPWSDADGLSNLRTCDAWLLRVRGARADEALPCAVAETRPHGRLLLAKLDGVDDRDAAAALAGAEIAVPRDRLRPLPPGEFYWTDLIGLAVFNAEGLRLGVVAALMETGANDVLVVEDAGRRRLIPYVDGDIVRAVDLDARRIEVAWGADWL